MVLTLKREFPLQVGEESPSRMEEFNYFRVLFMSEARDWQKDCSNVNGDAEAFLVCCGKEGPEHESQAVALPVKLCPCGHELKVVTERMKLWIQETDNRVSLRNMLSGSVRCSE